MGKIDKKRDKNQRKRIVITLVRHREREEIR